MKNLLNRIKELRKKIEYFELDRDDYIESYEDALDELYTCEIGSITYSASDVLKKVDPTAYNCGLNDYVYSLDIKKDSQYMKLKEELEELEELEEE